MYEDNHILTIEESQKYHLPDGKMYVIKFLFNDKWNQAVDPRPFKVKTTLIKKLANDSIGMPYVVNPNNTTTHLRGSHEGRGDTAQGLLEIQAKYAIGLIKVPIITSTNNVYGIVEVWKEYEKMVSDGLLPKETSPTLFVIKEDSDGIDDAQFLNINGVDKGGYPDILAGTHGMCKGGIKECMTELAPLGAAGKLIEARKDGLFLNTLKSLKGSMSAQIPDPALAAASPTEEKTEITLEVIAQKIDEVKAVEEKIVENVETNNSVLKEVATVTKGVDETQVVEKIGDEAAAESSSDSNPAIPTPAIIGAAGLQKMVIPKELRSNEFVKALIEKSKSDELRLGTLEKGIQEEANRKLVDARKAQATSIVDKMIAFKQISLDDKNTKIAEYMALKGEDGKLKDLELLDNYLKSTIPLDGEPEVIGASGSTIPTFHGDRVASKITNTQAMGIDL